MILALFDYVDTICYEQFDKETVYNKNQEMRDQTSVKGKLLSHKSTSEYICY